MTLNGPTFIRILGIFEARETKVASITEPYYALRYRPAEEGFFVRNTANEARSSLQHNPANEGVVENSQEALGDACPVSSSSSPSASSSRMSN